MPRSQHTGTSPRRVALPPPSRVSAAASVESSASAKQSSSSNLDPTPAPAPSEPSPTESGVPQVKVYRNHIKGQRPKLLESSNISWREWIELLYNMDLLAYRFARFASPIPETWLSAVGIRWEPLDLCIIVIHPQLLINHKILTTIIIWFLTCNADMPRLWTSSKILPHLPKCNTNQNKALLVPTFYLGKVWLVWSLKLCSTPPPPLISISVPRKQTNNCEALLLPCVFVQIN